MSQNIIDINVINNNIKISGAISLNIQVSEQFGYIGSQEIVIYGTNKVFHYVFANYNTNERQERLIAKLFFLQYEYFLPEFMQSFNYRSKDIIELGGISWQRDNFIDKTTLDNWDPKSDVYQLITFLEKKNFSFPIWTWNNRLAKMLNEEKNQELLILYIEEIPQDIMKTLFSNGKVVENQWEKEKIELKNRIFSAFTVL